MADPGTLLFGYFREHLLMTPADKNRIYQRFASYGRAHGYHLGKIFMEEMETAPAAFHKLVEATYLDNPAVIITPSRIHLSVISLDWERIWADFIAEAGTELKVLPLPFDHGSARCSVPASAHSSAGLLPQSAWCGWEPEAPRPADSRRMDDAALAPPSGRRSTPALELRTRTIPPVSLALQFRGRAEYLRCRVGRTGAAPPRADVPPAVPGLPAVSITRCSAGNRRQHHHLPAQAPGRCRPAQRHRRPSTWPQPSSGQLANPVAEGSARPTGRTHAA